MTTTRRRLASLGFLALLVALGPGAARPVSAAELTVLSAGAVRAVITELADAFRQETGHTVTITPGTVGVLRQKLAAGTPADVVIVSDTALDELTGQGVVEPGSRRDIARTAIGVAVKEGAPRPDVSTAEALKRALLEARSIVYIDPAQGGTSGIHFAAVLKRLGIDEAVKDKTVLWPGGYAAEALLQGKAELCVHQISELLPVKGITLVGPLPPDLQKLTVYSAGLPSRSRSPEAARAFIEFLARPAFKAKFAAAGLDYQP
jgi:molybdate transport system substrate-binding protein